MTTAYHPQADGQIERVNQHLKQYLRCNIDFNLNNWFKLLLTTEFIYNNQVHKSIKSSLFFLEYGRYSRAELTLNPDTTSTDLNNVIKAQLKIQEQVKAILILTVECMKQYYNKDV